MKNRKKILFAFIAVVAIVLSLFHNAFAAQQIVPARIIVNDCIVENGGLMTGSDGKVSFMLKNTSTTQSVYSVLVTAQWQNIASPPAEFGGVNQIYIDEIKPSEIDSATFKIKTKTVDLTSADNIKCVLAISYYTKVSELVPGPLDETGQLTGFISGNAFDSFVNTVTVQIPVRSEEGKTNAPDSPLEEQPSESQSLIFGLFTSTAQVIYVAGFLVCSLFTTALFIVRRRTND